MITLARSFPWRGLEYNEALHHDVPNALLTQLMVYDVAEGLTHTGLYHMRTDDVNTIQLHARLPNPNWAIEMQRRQALARR